MERNIEIKELARSEQSQALGLAWEVFMEFEAPDYPEEGIEEFRGFLNNESEIAELRFFGAFYEDEIAGVLAMRGDHISLFFVKKLFHKNGIGKRLFQYMKAQCGDGEKTVNSSPYAQKIYCKLGFTATNSEQITNGIRYIPMVYAGHQSQ